jgi:hypothetical protein
MRGILIAGTGSGSGEAELANALAVAAPGAVVVDAAGSGGRDGAAPPAIAARHAGAELRPAAVADEARAAGDGGGIVLLATAGGLLAPLGERYLNRDLAAELRLPVVLAAHAGTGLMNAMLLAVEAARGAGLAVAALVITGWPEQPGRVLVDETELLARHLGPRLPLHALPAAARDPDSLRQATEAWPVEAWADAAPGPVERSADDGAPAAAQVPLDPYDAWEERPVGDPRATPRREIMDGLAEIVAAEGPIRASRAYALYNRASGGRKLTAVARAPLSSALYWLAQEKRVALTPKDEIPWQDDDLIRPPDTAPVRVRELGPRTLEEVPLDEIAELAGRLRAARGFDQPLELKRAILSSYGLSRLTTRADEYLTLALDLAGVN